ncbi:MAG: zf-HC2 domain-containing protein [Planctomycetes bacterium]|nr:zf-HC2 domain-containing protein [Planctomycetota bacterium]
MDSMRDAMSSMDLPPGAGGCERVRDLLVPYVDGEVSPAEAVEVESHAASCSACSRALEEHRALERLIAGSRPSAAALLPALADRVRAAARRRRVARAWVLGIAALVLLAVGLVAARLEQGGDRGAVAESLIADLEILEAFEAEGVEPSPEVVGLLLGVPEDEAMMDSELFDVLVEGDDATEGL